MDMHQMIMASVKQKINEIRKEDSLVMPIFTDWHVTSCEDSAVKNLLEALFCLKEINPNGVIDLGDNLAMLGRNEHIANKEISSLLTDLFQKAFQTCESPIYFANGNHDGIGTDFFKADFWNEIVKNRYGNEAAQYGEEGSYYYVDFDESNTRLVFLSVPCDSDIEAKMPHPCWKFGEKQIRWLAEKALDTDKNVILISHVPFYYYYVGDAEKTLEVWNGNCTAKAYVKDLCGWIDDIEDVISILNAFQHQNGKLIAVLSGHTHVDSLWAPGESKDEYTNSLPCYQVVTRSVKPYGEEGEFRVALDLMVWTPSEGTLDLIRFGDGEDRKITI